MKHDLTFWESVAWAVFILPGIVSVLWLIAYLPR